MSKITGMPPFYMKQKVVAITKSDDGYRIKGNVYVINGLKKCHGCGSWTVDIGETHIYGKSKCFNCECSQQVADDII